ncbi:phospholipase ABHD3-like isoform X2 [Salvia divinorum]|uniref:Phospholipase ABHD3-like isoform X2 n=1 Tax=Salvia divinorum TaxID=28513 RepID=A0ABD1FPI9_SALDI
MIAAMGNEHADVEETPGDHDQTDQTVPVTDSHTFGARKSHSATNDTQTSEDNGGSKGSGIVRRCLHQLSRQTNKSIWLLAYIAIMSSWPLVGAALRYLRRRKLVKGLPGRGPK